MQRFPTHDLIAAGLAGCVGLAAAAAPAAAQEASELDALTAAVEQDVIAWRRDIHQNPELGNRETRTAALVATVLFVGSYFGNSLANLYDALDPIKPLILFTYYDTAPAVLTEGQAVADTAVLLATSLVLFLLAVWAFQRRNITVGAWPWQRAKVADI